MRLLGIAKHFGKVLKLEFSLGGSFYLLSVPDKHVTRLTSTQQPASLGNQYHAPLLNIVSRLWTGHPCSVAFGAR